MINNGEGPTVTLTGGVHGDEYEGPVTLLNLAREIDPAQVNGRIIMIPCLNLPAVQSGDRCSPIDDLNLNRVFPGNANGTVTEMIAHYISSEIVPLSGLHLDMHSGGKTLEYKPCIFLNDPGSKDKQENARRLVDAFGAEVTILEDDAFPDGGRFLTAAFARAGVLNFSCELGGAGQVNPAIVSMATHGAKNMLREFGVLSGEVVSPENQGRLPSIVARVPDGECYIMAEDSGLYEPFIDLGDPVSAGQVIGQIHYPDDLAKSPLAVTSSRTGFLLCKRAPGKTRRGDNIAIIAQAIS